MFSAESKVNIKKKTPAPDSAGAMDAELRRIARYRALTLWRFFASILLAAFEAMCALLGLRVSSGLYVLFSMNLLPWVLEAFCSPYIKKTPPVMPYLRRQYRYCTLRFATTGITFFITSLLLALWQLHNSAPDYPAAWLYDFPAILLICGILFLLAAPPALVKHMRRKLGVL